jgi:hypothetical protein
MEEYREAWHLKGDKPDEGETITSQACAEEFASSLPAAFFLSLPQGSRILHSLFTRVNCFSVAARGNLNESGFTENVGSSQLAER